MLEEKPKNEIFEGKELSYVDKDGVLRFDPKCSTTLRCAVIPLALVNKMGRSISEFNDIVSDFKSCYDAFHAIYDGHAKVSFVYTRDELPEDRCVICKGTGISHDMRTEERSVSQVIDETGTAQHTHTAVAVLSCKCMDCTFEWRQLCVLNTEPSPVTEE